MTVVAEAGVAHGGRLDSALQLVDFAAEVGADLVKLQTWQPFAGDPYGHLRLPESAWPRLQAAAHRCGIGFFSTAFDFASLDLLADLGVPLLKVGSAELCDVPLLRHAARKGLPLILSTGMATEAEIKAALVILWRAGCANPILLACTSAYPTPPAEVNLRAVKTLAMRFGLRTGLSMHLAPQHAIPAACAAVALGACMIEAHITLDRAGGLPDDPASLEPADFAAMVRAIRATEVMLGTGEKVPQPSEMALWEKVRGGA